MKIKCEVSHEGQSQHIQSSYLAVKGLLKEVSLQSALPMSTPSEHNSAQPGIEFAISIACKSPTL